MARLSDLAAPWLNGVAALSSRLGSGSCAVKESGVEAGELRRRDTRLVSLWKSEAKYRSAREGEDGDDARAVSELNDDEVMVIARERMNCPVKILNLPYT